MFAAATTASILILTGLGAILGAIGAPGALFDIGKETAPGVLFGVGLACVVLGGLWLRAVSRSMENVKQLWMDYATNARTAAESIKNGRIIDPPKRPMPVSDTIVDFTTARPLQPDELKDAVATRLTDGIASLLQPCGEERTYLGRADAVVFQWSKDGSTKSDVERLTDVWVIDREWSDGRWSTEWLVAMTVGHRLRLVGGGTAIGPHYFRDLSRKSTRLLQGFGALCIFVGGYSGIWAIFIYAPLFQAVREYLCMWNPVRTRPSGALLANLTLPGVAFGIRRTLPSHEAALKIRVTDVLADIEPLSVR